MRRPCRGDGPRQRRSAAGRARTGPALVDPVDRALLGALVTDGRMGWAELAQRTGSSPATVRRRLRRPTDAEVPTFRRDIATVHRTLEALAECRLVAAVTGTDDLFAPIGTGRGPLIRQETGAGGP
ncbi:AsnC family protein [Streptomyces sp. PKU-EA00015]|uniref:AsnC family protein n=1 Tax=Streptomyces sp. PKU-EA00015 TaxID=2748326 RepID=UPI0015A42149|nr:AsnC family protein [Streptomyces sp. PKU-EA00015]NWF26833.1 AsnC family protein [Streptomyces sp. PKU-EA00015]